MTSSTSSTSRSKPRSWAWLVAVFGLLLMWSSVAQAGRRKRVVVLDFEGPSAERFHADIVKMLKHHHTVLSTDKWNGMAGDMDASKVTERNVKKVARRLKIDAIVQGRIEKRRDSYIIRLQLRGGTNGELVGHKIDTSSDEPRLSRRAERDLRDELVAAIDALPTNDGDDGGDDGGGDDREARDRHHDDDRDDHDARDRHRDSDRDGDRDRDSDRRHHSGFASRDDDLRGRDRVGKHGRDDDRHARDDDRHARDDDHGDRDDDRHRDDDRRDRDDDRHGRRSHGDDVASRDRDDDHGDRDRSRDGDERSDGDDGDEDGDKDHDKRVADRGDGDDGDGDGDGDGDVEASASAGPAMDSALALSPGQRAVDATVGLSFTARRLKFSYNSQLAGDQIPPGYRQSVPVAGAVLDATVYPLAFGHKRHDALAGLGVQVMYDRVLFINSQKLYGQPGMQQVAKLATSESRYKIGAVFRHPFGLRPTAPVVGAELGYGKQAFTIAQTLPDPMMTNTDIPNVDYGIIDLGAFVKYPVSPKITLDAHAAFMALTKLGSISASDQYGKPKSKSGFEGQVGGEYKLTKNLFLHAAIRVETIGLGFSPDAGMKVNNRDTDPTTQDVAGARDTYFGGTATIGYAY